MSYFHVLLQRILACCELRITRYWNSAVNPLSLPDHEQCKTSVANGLSRNDTPGPHPACLSRIMTHLRCTFLMLKSTEGFVNMLTYCFLPSLFSPSTTVASLTVASPAAATTSDGPCRSARLARLGPCFCGQRRRRRGQGCRCDCPGRGRPRAEALGAPSPGALAGGN